jgi:hypothetical protein
LQVELEAVIKLAREIPREQLPRLLASLEEIRAVTFLRMLEPPPAEDKLLTARECAARLRVSPAYLYQNHKKFPFVKRIGSRLLFSSNGLDLYLKKSR